MPPRPSQNIAERLVQAGRELLPHTGCRGLSIRQLTERAGVNLGMFHYHFKTKDAFIRALLQASYETMFASLSIETGRSAPPLENLRAGVNVLGRFARDHRQLLTRIFADAFAGEQVAVEFLRDNLGRHLTIIVLLIGAAQASGALKRLAPLQVIGLLAGGVAMPIFAGTVLARSAFAPEGFLDQFEQTVLTDAAIAERVDAVLAGLRSD